METALLTTEGPCLAWDYDDQEEDPRSDFVRLIEQRSEHPLPNSERNLPLVLHPDLSPTEYTLVDGPRTEVVTIFASVCCILHIGLTWSAYLAPEWSETTTVARSNGTVVSTTVVAEQMTRLVQELDESGNGVLETAIWCTSVFLPCAFMILAPLSVFPTSAQWGFCFFGWTLRWSLLLFYVIILLSLPIQDLELGSEDDSLLLRQSPTKGLASYALSIAAGFGVLVALQWPREKFYVQQVPEEEEPPADDEEEVFSQQSVPPMTALEDEPPREAPVLHVTRHAESSSSGSSTPVREPLWKVLTMCGTALLSLILLPLSYVLPLAQWSYAGPDTPPHERILLLYKLPMMLRAKDMPLTTSDVSVACVLMPTLFALPAIVLKLSCAVWWSVVSDRGDWKDRLRCFQPTTGSTVFAAALIGATLAQPSWSKVALQSPSCQDCVEIQAVLKPGAWVLLAQAVATDVFVWLTLQWS